MINSKTNNLRFLNSQIYLRNINAKVQNAIKNNILKHKASINAFNTYINKLKNEGDNTKLKEFSLQLDNLTPSFNTLPWLKKVFTSQKRTTKIKATIEKKKIINALPEIELEDIIVNLQKQNVNKNMKIKK